MARMSHAFQVMAKFEGLEALNLPWQGGAFAPHASGKGDDGAIRGYEWFGRVGSAYKAEFFGLYA